MADGQAPRRQLRLSRETLKRLEPTAEEAGTVRGGQVGTRTVCGEEFTCHSACPDQCPMPSPKEIIGGPTHFSWGCKGRIEVYREPDRIVYEFDLHPNEELLRFLQQPAPDSKKLPAARSRSASKKAAPAKRPAAKRAAPKRKPTK